VEEGHVDIIVFLIEFGSQINIKIRSGQSLYHVIPSLAMVEFLFDHEVEPPGHDVANFMHDPRYHDKLNRNPLHTVRDVGLVDFFVSIDPSPEGWINTKDSELRTPLDLAVDKPIEIIEELLLFGAIFTIKSVGETILQELIDNNSDPFFIELVEDRLEILNNS